MADNTLANRAIMGWPARSYTTQQGCHLGQQGWSQALLYEFKALRTSATVTVAHAPARLHQLWTILWGHVQGWQVVGSAVQYVGTFRRHSLIQPLRWTVTSLHFAGRYGPRQSRLVCSQTAANLPTTEQYSRLAAGGLHLWPHRSDHSVSELVELP
jgi:hypothetical protein